MITNAQSGTNIQEVADGIYRINTPIAIPDGSPFNFNQYLIVDDQPMLFHTGQSTVAPTGARGHRLSRHAGKQAEIRCFLAFRGRRMRSPESLSGDRAQRGDRCAARWRR